MQRRLSTARYRAVSQAQGEEWPSTHIELAPRAGAGQDVVGPSNGGMNQPAPRGPPEGVEIITSRLRRLHQGPQVMLTLCRSLDDKEQTR